MALTRVSSSNRRRLTMRKAAAIDSGVATEAARAAHRRRANHADDDNPNGVEKLDPGYSQEVRFACQQRLVNLIPVRRAAMATFASVCLGIWLSLLVVHYLFRVAYQPFQGMPIEHFVDIRSPHGFSHWLGSQLWFLTGIAAVLILQLRKHKLDDYRAKYRIWAFLAAGCFFCSFDVASSALYIVGLTIDPWTSSELGYRGWPVTLATFASLVGVLGLRLCTELKSSPGSVSLWLTGLLSWAFSAVVGTGLFKLNWETTTVDMAVGASWLGGILAVFLASTLYLRHIYIQAQKRFALRNKWLSEKSTWQMPQIKDRIAALSPGRLANGLKSRFRRSEVMVAPSVTVAADKPKPSAKMVVSRDEYVDDQDVEENEVFEGDHSVATPVMTSSTKAEQRAERRAARREASGGSSRRLFGWLRPRKDPKLGDDYSDLGNDVRLRDRGFGSGFEKVSETKQAAANASATSPSGVQASKSSAQSTQETTAKSRFYNPFAKRKSPTPTIDTASTAHSESKANSEATKSSSVEKSKRSWSFSMKRKSQDGNATKTTTVQNAGKEAGEPAAKRSWLSRRDKTQTPKVEKIKREKPATTTSTKKRRIFGFLDGLTLKPPAEGVAAEPKTAASSNVPQRSIPSTSSTNTASQPTIQSSQTREQPMMGSFDEIEDAEDYRNMSKAERKKLRRQQNQNRAA